MHTRPFQFSRSPKIEKKNPRENTDSDFVSYVAHFRERERESEAIFLLLESIAFLFFIPLTMLLS